MSLLSVRSGGSTLTAARPTGSSSAGRAAYAQTSFVKHDPQWARDAIAECRRVGAAPFLKQWGTYKNNPFVFEDRLTEEQAMRRDPPKNGKGGGKLDGKLWRDFPNIASRTKAKTVSRERGDKNASEGSREIYAG